MKTSMLDVTPLTPGTCEWCGKNCELENTACSLSCEAQLRRLEAAQGLMVIRALKGWRRSPNHAARNEAIAKIVPMVDGFLRTDRERRERAGAARRQKEAEAARAKAAQDEAALDGTGATQTSAPVTNQPEVGDLDGGFPQGHDANKRGFAPK